MLCLTTDFYVVPHTVINVQSPYLYIQKLDSSLVLEPAFATIVFRCIDVKPAQINQITL